MERLRKEEEAASVSRKKTQLEQTVCSLEQELTEKHELLETLQVKGCMITGAVLGHFKQYLFIRTTAFYDFLEWNGYTAYNFNDFKNKSWV